MRPFRERMCRLAVAALVVVAMDCTTQRAPGAVAAQPTASPALMHSAPTPPPHQRATYTYKTFLDPATVDYWQIGKFNVEFGTMTLTFDPDASVHGTYTPDNGNATTVTGSMSGGNVRLALGGRRYVGRFTPRGLAFFSDPNAAGRRWRLWGRFVRAQQS